MIRLGLAQSNMEPASLEHSFRWQGDEHTPRKEQRGKGRGLNRESLWGPVVSGMQVQSCSFGEALCEAEL